MDEIEAGKKKRSLGNGKLKAKRASEAETEELRKDRLRKRLERDRERRTKKLQEENIRLSETKDHKEQHLATLKRLKRR